MMKVRLVMVVLLCAAAGAMAQSKKELIDRVLAAQQTGIENVGRALAGQLSQRALQAAAQAMPRVPADKREAVGRDIQADIKKFHDEIEPLLRERALKLAPTAVAAMYEERFTEDELKQAVAWLESPTSKKFAQIDQDAGNALAEKVVADSRPVVEGKMKALEASIAKRLGLPPAPAASAPKK